MPSDQSQNVVDALSCRRQSFWQVWYKLDVDCMRNANKCTKIPNSATVKKNEKVIWNPQADPDHFLSERTPLERCCVHNMSPFISSSGLSPGSHEAKVQRAKVCLNCTEPIVASVARSSCWSLPVGRYLSDTRCKGSMVVLAR